MNRKFWKICGAFVATGLAVAVNFATESKYSVLVWAVVIILVALMVWLDFMGDQDGQPRVISRRRQQTLPVLRWEERNGDVRRTVSTTSEKVASEFLKSVSPSPSSPHEPSNRSSSHS